MRFFQLTPKSWSVLAFIGVALAATFLFAVRITYKEELSKQVIVDSQTPTISKNPVEEKLEERIREQDFTQEWFEKNSKPQAAFSKEQWSEKLSRLNLLRDRLSSGTGVEIEKDAKEFESLLNEFFASPQRLSALLDLLSQGVLDSREQENAVWLLSQFLSVANHLDGNSEAEQEVRDFARSMVARLLLECPLWHLDRAQEILAALLDSPWVDASSLAQLQSLMSHPALRLESGRLLMQIAFQGESPRMDLLGPILHGSDGDLRSEVLQKLAHVDAKVADSQVRLALDSYPQERWKLLPVAVQVVDAGFAFSLLEMEARKGELANESALIPLFGILSSRGFGDLAAERFTQEGDWRARKGLLIAGHKNAELLSLAAEFDPNFEVRGQAFLLLGNERADVQAVELFANAMARILASPIEESRLGITEASLLLLGLGSLEKRLSSQDRANPVFSRVQSQLRELSSTPRFSESTRQRAKQVDELFSSSRTR